MVQQLASSPSEKDIHDTVLSVLRGMDDLMTGEPQKVSRALAEFDYISPRTKLVGRGEGTRHKLMRVEVALVGPTKSKLNPHLTG